jgi:hypothetical protein
VNTTEVIVDETYVGALGGSGTKPAIIERDSGEKALLPIRFVAEI